MSILELHAVGKSYGSVVAMHEVSLCVEAGSRAAIVGPSGSGKTTLLRVVAGFETPDAGRVMLNGEVLADGGRIVPAHLRGIGYVPQEGALFPHLDVAANIAFGLREEPSRRHAQVGALMDMVALDRKLSTRWPHELSGGQQQRVALARALARRPQLMLLDEPFSALDTGLRAATRKAVAQVLADAGVTTILVTHDQAEALSFADQLAVMRDGRLVQAGRPLDVYRRPIDEATALFLGDAVIVPARLHGGWADCALGHIEVDDPRSGTARIMVRPEQIGVSAASRGAAPQCHGTIVDIDFSGQLCELSIRLASTLQSSGDDDPLLTVRVPSAELPVAGARVLLEVTGRAHVLAARAGEV